MKGIILAGGYGTRLYPLTKSISKQLLPVYDKPMIYYPLSVLMMADIKEFLIISTPEDLPIFKKLLGNGSELGLQLNYAEQDTPAGLAQAFIIGKDFIGKDSVALILGDNIFYGNGFEHIIKKASCFKSGASIFAYHVADPERYGIITFNNKNQVISIDEKPIDPKSNYAIPGLYFYDNDVVKLAENLEPSNRGEFEITDINKIYLKNNKLSVHKLTSGFTWLDTGTHESLHQASSLIEALEKRQGIKIACIEEIAYQKKYINQVQLMELGLSMKQNDYGQYLIRLSKDKE